MTEVIKSEQVANLIRRINDVIKLRQETRNDDILPELIEREAKLRRMLDAELNALNIGA